MPSRRGWQLYYDLRNRLILASFNNDLFSLESPTRLLKLLMVHLIRYDYQHAWFMLQAVSDFLKGPELLNEGLPAIHQRITQGSIYLAPEKMRAALGLDAAIADGPARPWAIRGRMLGSLARVPDRRYSAQAARRALHRHARFNGSVSVQVTSSRTGKIISSCATGIQNNRRGVC